MSLLGSCCSTVLEGVVSAVSLQETLKFLNQTSKIETVGSVLLLNGFIFGGSLMVRDFLMFPLIFDPLVRWFAGGDGDEGEQLVVKEFSRQMFDILLLVPIFILSNLLNIVWCSEIVEDAFKKAHAGQKRPPPRPAQENIREELYRAAFFLVLVMQSFLCLMLLPRPLGAMVDFVQQCFLLAFYCYDYGWALQGLKFQARLDRFQSHWLFMLGFGMPLGLISSALPMFWGYMLSSLLFPFCAILAIQRPPKKHSRGWDSLQTFRFAQFVTLYLIKFVTSRF